MVQLLRLKIMGCTPNTLPAVAFGEALAQANLEQLALEIIPNPVFQSAVVRFYVPQDGFVTVKVHDLKGKLIETLHQQYAAAGWNEVVFYPRYIGSGMYFATVQTPNALETKRMVVQRN
ncbi:MAG: T9SS type A sorting domain-containing protein [Saprospiraceae bacterium]|nr:T9SS type A sorting domain-containing protein [Saprospiraceae bacterium]